MCCHSCTPRRKCSTRHREPQPERRGSLNPLHNAELRWPSHGTNSPDIFTDPLNTFAKDCIKWTGMDLQKQSYLRGGAEIPDCSVFALGEFVWRDWLINDGFIILCDGLTNCDLTTSILADTLPVIEDVYGWYWVLLTWIDFIEICPLCSSCVYPLQQHSI